MKRIFLAMLIISCKTSLIWDSKVQIHTTGVYFIRFNSIWMNR